MPHDDLGRIHRSQHRFVFCLLSTGFQIGLGCSLGRGIRLIVGIGEFILMIREFVVSDLLLPKAFAHKVRNLLATLIFSFVLALPGGFRGFPARLPTVETPLRRKHNEPFNLPSGKD